MGIGQRVRTTGVSDAFSDSLREVPAVHPDVGPGDETTGLGAGQEERGAGEPLGRPELASSVKRLWLAPTADFDAPRLWLTAELLYLEALDARASSAEGGGRADFARALALFDHLPPDWKPTDGFVTAAARAEEIRSSYLSGRASG